MKIILAIDSFKGSLTSLQSGNAICEGIKKAYSDAETMVRPIADGGEGTVDTLVAGLRGERKTASVTGPLGEKIQAQYGIVNCDTALKQLQLMNSRHIRNAKQEK